MTSAQVDHATVDVHTEDGVCPTHVFRPASDGRWPGVLMFMDGLGIRPALFEIAARLASGGYTVALPDLYYRSGFTVPDGARLFSDALLREDWMTRVLPTVSPANIARDMPALLATLDDWSQAPDAIIGTTGYCLGGRLSLAMAGRFPDRIAAAASFHGGHLATDAPDSPHLLAPAMRARVYVAGAIKDAGFDDAQKQRLEDALTAAGIDHVVETYDALHGWVPSDTPVHDPAATERHWRSLFALLEETLPHEGGARGNPARA